MSLRVGSISGHGLRAGVLAGLLAIGVSGCHKGPYKPLPQEKISPETEKVLTEFTKKGERVKNDSTYIFICNDTIRLKDKYIKDPSSLSNHLAYLEDIYNSPSDNDDVSYLFRNSREYVVTSNQVFVDKNNRAYIAISAYENTNRKNQ